MSLLFTTKSLNSDLCQTEMDPISGYWPVDKVLQRDDFQHDPRRSGIQAHQQFDPQHHIRHEASPVPQN